MTDQHPINPLAVIAQEALAAPDALGDRAPTPGDEASSASIGQLVPVAVGKLPLGFQGKLRLVLSQKGVAYGVARSGGNPLALPVGGRQMNNILRTLANEEGSKLRNFDIAEINESLIAHAEMSAVVEPVWFRVAPIEGGIELDLGDEKNTRVTVRAGSVAIVPKGSQTLFYRTPVSAAFVMPAEEGNLDLLRKYLNLHDMDRLLLTAWLSYTLAHPKVPTSKYPILVINGDQGTGKTSLCNNVIYPLVDPNVIGVQVFPGSAKDLAIASQNAHVLCYDNMRNFRVAMADILCMAATGGAISNRALYTNADQHVHFLHVALVLNGIHHFITQADLAQRTLCIRTVPLPEEKRMAEAAMVKELKADMPVIFRGLLDLIAKVFECLPKAEVTDPERMLDFVQWLAAMEVAEGTPAGIYQGAYSSSLRQAQLDSLMENLLASAVMDFCAKMKSSKWRGSPAQLLSELENMTTTGTKYAREWPQNAIALSKRLAGLKASLETQGISLESGRGKERTITIRKMGGGDHA